MKFQLFILYKLHRLFFNIPKYVSNIAFNNWCYRLSFKFDEIYTRRKKNDIQSRLTEIEIKLKRIEKFIELYSDDGK